MSGTSRPRVTGHAGLVTGHEVVVTGHAGPRTVWIVGLGNSKAARARRKRGQYRRTLTIPDVQLRRLVEFEYLERVGLPVAEVRALEAFLFDGLGF